MEDWLDDYYAAFPDSSRSKQAVKQKIMQVRTDLLAKMSEDKAKLAEEERQG